MELESVCHEKEEEDNKYLVDEETWLLQARQRLLTISESSERGIKLTDHSIRIMISWHPVTDAQMENEEAEILAQRVVVNDTSRPKPQPRHFNEEDPMQHQEVEKNECDKLYPLFNDLSLEGERIARNRKGGAQYYLMPFRTKLYREGQRQTMNATPQPSNPDQNISAKKRTNSAPSSSEESKILFWSDPTVYAPTGDIYSYLNRRRVRPMGYSAPTQHQVDLACGGRRKNCQ